MRWWEAEGLEGGKSRPMRSWPVHSCVTLWGVDSGGDMKCSRDKVERLQIQCNGCAELYAWYAHAHVLECMAQHRQTCVL